VHGINLLFYAHRAAAELTQRRLIARASIICTIIKHFLKSFIFYDF